MSYPCSQNEKLKVIKLRFKYRYKVGKEGQIYAAVL